MKIAVKTLDNAEAGDIELSDEVFGVEARADLLARMVAYQLAKRRSGNHKVLQRHEVAGANKKIGNQKGGGRARHGNKKAPQFRGGGVVFGPHVRDHSHDLPKKVRRLAMKSALSAKVRSGKLIVLDSTEMAEPKTKALIAKFSGLGLANALIIDGPEVNANFRLAARNIPHVDVLPQQGANVYDILRRDTLVLTKAAVEHLEARLK